MGVGVNGTGAVGADFRSTKASRKRAMGRIRQKIEDYTKLKQLQNEGDDGAGDRDGKDGDDGDGDRDGQD